MAVVHCVRTLGHDRAQSAGTMRSPSRCALAPEGVGVGSAVGFGVMDTSAVTSGVASPGCGVSAGRGVAVTGA